MDAGYVKASAELAKLQHNRTRGYVRDVDLE
jgi:hypothetical protein